MAQRKRKHSFCTECAEPLTQAIRGSLCRGCLSRRRCAFPGCDRRVNAHGVCLLHNPVREIPGYRDMYCQICGFGPRVRLAAHINAFHDGTADYKRRFGWDSVSSTDFRDARRAIMRDQIADGRFTLPTRKRTCRRGHRLTKTNTKLTTYRKGPRAGRTVRQCRKCLRASEQRRYEARRPHHRRRKCRNPECRGWYMPVRSDQLYCSQRCNMRANYLRRTPGAWCNGPGTDQPVRATPIAGRRDADGREAAATAQTIVRASSIEPEECAVDSPA